MLGVVIYCSSTRRDGRDGTRLVEAHGWTRDILEVEPGGAG